MPPPVGEALGLGLWVTDADGDGDCVGSGAPAGSTVAATVDPAGHDLPGTRRTVSAVMPTR